VAKREAKDGLKWASKTDRRLFNDLFSRTAWVSRYQAG